jgi:ribosomal protein S18 acetylase RimI-like enzyme
LSNAPLSIVTRDARLSDAATIIDFNIRLAEETEGLRLDPLTLGVGVQALLMDPTKGRYFMAEVDGEVVGQLMHTREWSDWRNGDLWWIQSVYVDPAYRGQGVFRKLMEHLRMLAQRTPGVVGLRLYVEEHNDKAKQAYTRLGMNAAPYGVMESVWGNAPMTLWPHGRPAGARPTA